MRELGVSEMINVWKRKNVLTYDDMFCFGLCIKKLKIFKIYNEELSYNAINTTKSFVLYIFFKIMKHSIARTNI